MINWCAYCQEYQGETPPFDNFIPTHGICARCKEKGLDLPEEKLQAIRVLKDLQERLWTAGKTENRNAIDDLISDAVQYQVRPVDVLVGLLAPMLYQIGADWARGKITIADEHRFTAFAIDVLSNVRTKMKMEEPRGRDERLRVLLLNADGNDHSLGIQILEVFLRSSGIPAKAIYPGIPFAEAIQLTAEIKPEWLGISISLADQIPSVIEIVDKITELFPAMKNKIFLGGNAVRKYLVPAISGTIQISELGAMLKFLREI